jgi:hypothetical protein
VEVAVGGLEVGRSVEVRLHFVELITHAAELLISEVACEGRHERRLEDDPGGVELLGVGDAGGGDAHAAIWAGDDEAVGLQAVKGLPNRGAAGGEARAQVAVSEPLVRAEGPVDDEITQPPIHAVDGVAGPRELRPCLRACLLRRPRVA